MKINQKLLYCKQLNKSTHQWSQIDMFFEVICELHFKGSSPKGTYPQYDLKVRIRGSLKVWSHLGTIKGKNTNKFSVNF